MLGEYRLAAAQRVAPFSLPEVLEVDQLDAGLAPRSPNDVYTVFPHRTARKFVPLSSQAVAIPMLAGPLCSDDLALSAARSNAVATRIGSPHALSIEVGIGTDVEVCDALAVLRSVTALTFPAVHDMTDLLSAKPSIYGRTDSDDIASDQPSLIPQETGAAAGTCRHGLPRGSCDTCRRERASKQKKQPVKGKGVSIADVLELLWLYLQPPLDPKTLKGIFPLPIDEPLMPHQFQGIQFLVERRGALLADEMGLGKTAQAIVAARLLLRTADVTRILVVVPKSLLQQWRIQWEGWAQREVRVQVVDGQRERRQQQWEAPAHVWIVSYETLRGDLPSVHQLRDFGLVILDEATKVKNSSAKTTRAVRDLPSRRCWALTGTPLENNPDDLISILRLIAVDSSVRVYVDKIIAALPWLQWRTPEEKRDLMQPVMLRRRWEDVPRDSLGDVPEDPVEEELWLPLAPEQRKAYEAALAEAQGAVRELGENVTKRHIFAQLQKLKQLCNFHLETDSSAKADFLVEHLGEIAPEDKILVFSQYPNVSLPALKDRLQSNFPMLEIYHGGLSTRQREDLQEIFEHDPQYRVLLMGLKVAGLGLNLQVANHVVLFDHWWNPATHKQAIGRAVRIGQEKKVVITPLFTVDTVEERIYSILHRKEALFKAIVDDASEAQKEVEQNLTLEDLLTVLDLPLPEQRARQEKMDSRASGNDGSRFGHSHGTDEGPGVSSAPSWSGSWDKQRLKELSPSEFEELVARLYQVRGYHAEKTRDSRDGGVDVIAESMATAAKQKLLIQCKHTESESVVGVPVVRQLAGVLSNTPDATNAVVVTNGEFSKDAHREVQNSRVELVNGQSLLYLLDQLMGKHQST